MRYVQNVIDQLRVFRVSTHWNRYVAYGSQQILPIICVALVKFVVEIDTADIHVRLFDFRKSEH